MNLLIVVFEFSEETAVSVRENLKSYLGTNDILYIGTTSAPSAWFTSMGQNVTDYIKKDLKLNMFAK